MFKMFISFQIHQLLKGKRISFDLSALTFPSSYDSAVSVKKEQNAFKNALLDD